MKLLISNYGGTLKPNIKDLKINLKIVREFMRKGNLFCIATKRPYLSIKREICIYDIPYDYLICNNGSVILNRCDKVVHASYIEPENVEDIKRIITNYGFEANLYDEYGQVTDVNRTIDIDTYIKNIFPNQKMEKEIMNTSQQLLLYRKLYHLCLKYKTNKAEAINKLLELENIDIEKNDIITVGDSFSDIEMLREYNGHKVLHSYPFIYGKGIKTCFEVKTLVKSIMN